MGLAPFEGPRGRFCSSLSLWLADGCLLPVSPFMFFLHIPVSKFSLLVRTPYWIMYHFQSSTSSKEPACQSRRHERMRVQSLGQEDPLEEEMATHSNILARRIPWTEEPGRHMGLQRVRHD